MPFIQEAWLQWNLFKETKINAAMAKGYILDAETIHYQFNVLQVRVKWSTGPFEFRNTLFDIRDQFSFQLFRIGLAEEGAFLEKLPTLTQV